MELKYIGNVIICRLLFVSIEPLWNWNFRNSRTTRALNSYQSNLYGIEIKLPASFVSCPRGINRTFMELKFLLHFGCCRLTTSINRTFMELKCEFQIWWKSVQMRINRTFMELKYDITGLNEYYPTVSIEPLWNWNTHGRTSELRPASYQSNLYGIEINLRCIYPHSRTRINRTFMELKSMSSMSVIPLLFVSIEPLWNWNMRAWKRFFSLSCINRTFMELKWMRDIQLATSLKYQSNLYGIEICFGRSSGSMLIWYQSNLYGIEICFGRSSGSMLICINRTFMELKYDIKSRKLVSHWAVSIEPLWNWNSPWLDIDISTLRINRTFMELKLT